MADVAVHEAFHGPVRAGRIGPNALIQAAAALRDAEGPDETERLFAAAGLLERLRHPPTEMVDEAEAASLHRALRGDLGVARALAVAADAGWRTADYLLAHRIPRPAQLLMKVLPARLAAPVLLSAIRRNAWTFVGSGRITVEPGRPARILVEDGPLVRGEAEDEPLCAFYAGTFERLFRVLVHPDTVCVEIECAGAGGVRCVFELVW